MSDDDVRRALARYADTTPALDPRTGLRERLVRRERARRAAVAGTAAVLLVVAGTGVAALARHRDRAGIVAADPTETPSATPSATATASPSPTAPESPAADPAAPIVRTATGPDGLRVRVTFTPGSPETATAASLRVETWDDDGHPVVAAIRWGDGSAEPIQRVMAGCVIDPPPPGASPPPREKEPGETDKTYTHSWRHDGRVTVRVEVDSEGDCVPDPPDMEEAAVSFAVDVRPGAVTSNGPARPAADAEAGYRDGGGVYDAFLRATLTDADGHVTSATIDWGDGSAPATVRNDTPCDDGNGRHYPAPADPWAEWHVSEQHDYGTPGTYRITLTYVSAGCDGAHEQPASQVVKTLEFESVD